MTWGFLTGQLLTVIIMVGVTAIAGGFTLIWIGAFRSPRRVIPRLRLKAAAIGIAAAIIRTALAIAYAHYSTLSELHPAIRLHTEKGYLYFCSPIMGFISGFAWTYVLLKYTRLSKPVILALVIVAAVVDFILLLPVTPQ